jgi:Tfp pilus assembly pilus retraction ATPase PilT
VEPRRSSTPGSRRTNSGTFNPAKPVGCKVCNDRGYKGRVAVYEVMPFFDPLKELVINGASTAEIKQEAIRLGMQTLRAAALKKMMAGVTTLEEVVGNTRPTGFRKNGESVANLHQLLKAMVEKGASDLHITTGSPPQLRIDGKLVPLKTAPLTPVETKQLCYSILTDAQKHKFEEENELDLSFGVKGLSRFRANIFMQRGAVAGAFRTIPFKILTFQELGLPPVVSELSKRSRAGWSW